MFLILAILAFIVVILFFGAHAYQQQQKRLGEIVTLAQDMNWKFVSDPDYSFETEYSQFSVFRTGDSRYAYNTMRGGLRFGEEAWPARMGDYHYETTSTHDGKTETTNHHFSYALIDLPYASLPNLRIRREGVFDKLANAFGFSDINFESAEFSKRFHVKSSDKKFAYDIVYPAMMEFLLADDPPTIEIGGGRCCLTTGRTWSADEFQHNIHWAIRFFDLWPKHLVADLRTR